MDATMRIRHITQLIENARFHATLRHGMLGKPEIGIVVNDDVMVWGTVPESAEDDAQFVEDLVAKAKNKAR